MDMTEQNGRVNTAIMEANPWRIRRIFPQFLACSAINLILFDIGLVLSFSTILIGALLNSESGDLIMNDEDASWFASITYLCQPVGSLISGFAMGPLGRKRYLLILNVPFFIAWTMLFYANSITMLYAAGGILGFSVGYAEAPIVTYLGEIADTTFRGTLTSYAQFCTSLAFVVVYFVGAITSWRYTAAFCAAVPIISLIAISQIPETPLWLISRGKIEAAENALCWLRGWVKPEDVKQELNELIKYHAEFTDISKTVSSAQSGSQEIIMGSQKSFKQKIGYFVRPEMMKPLSLIISYYFFFYGSGLQTIRPYLEPVFKDLNISVDVNMALVAVAAIGLLGMAICMVTVSQVGKRALTLFSLAGCAVCNYILAIVASKTLSGSLGFPFMLGLSFFTSVGIHPIPWMLQSELYPFEGKCMAAGIAAASSYLIGFIAVKCFFALESILELWGVFVLFGSISVLGILYMYMRLPETEGKTFQEIEEEFTERIIKRRISLN